MGKAEPTSSFGSSVAFSNINNQTDNNITTNITTVTRTAPNDNALATPGTPTRHSTHAASPHADNGRPSKRQKVTRACDSCKSRKRRCTGELPCKFCWASGAQCTYNASYTRGRIVKPLPSEHADSNSPQVSSTWTSTGVTTSKRARSPNDEEPTTCAGQYLGPAAAYSFLRRAWKRLGGDTHAAGNFKQENSDSAVSIFAFGDKPIASSVVTNFRLPDRATTRRLLDRYFDWTMPTFRFLHRQTVSEWLETYHQQEILGPEMVPQAAIRQAVVLETLATVSLYDMEEDGATVADAERLASLSEQLHQVARSKLANETGRVVLPSVQARLLTVIYLLQTSRPNQAWFTLGTAVQMLFALGLHRAGTGPSAQVDPISAECRKRVFWSASSLDAYLTIALGRPPLIHEEDIDQDYPQCIDDEELASPGRLAASPSRDRVMAGSVLHAKLSRIIKQAIREQYTVTGKSCQRKINTATNYNAEIAAWQDSLPPLLSGAVHSSSLVPVFRRQSTILQLAHQHAVMLVNRPLLLEEITSASPVKTHINACLRAARRTLEYIMASGANQILFPILWISQYVTFTSLSVTYVWLLQRRRGRFAGIEPDVTDEELLMLAERVQTRLSDMTLNSAPSLRYSIVLEELQNETRRLLGTLQHPQKREQAGVSDHDAIKDVSTHETSAEANHLVNDSLDRDILDWENWNSNVPLDPDLWLQLDSVPFANVAFED